MSETVRSYGYMAVLKTPIDSERREELSDQLRAAKSNIGINYEGTLLYSDKNRHADYNERTEFCGLNLGADNSAGTPDDFIALATAAGLEVDPTTVHPYNCIWYNGSDSDIDLLDKEEFLERVTS